MSLTSIISTTNNQLENRDDMVYSQKATNTLFIPKSGGSFTGSVNETMSTSIASASYVIIGDAGVAGNYVHITGTTTITAFDSIQAGTERTLVFDGSFTLTHNAVSLILPGGVNIITAAGDMAKFRSEGSGNWRCVTYTRADGTPLALWDYSSPVATTIQSVTSDPTKSTSPDADSIRYRLWRTANNKNWYQVDMLYAANSATGAAAGNGNYLYTLPGGLQWDTTEHPFYTGTTTNGFTMRYCVDLTQGVLGLTGFLGDAMVIPYDATRFRLLAKNGNGIQNFVGSGNYNINGGGVVYNVNFIFKSL